MKDPLDVGASDEKAWQEFRATFGAVFLHAWLVSEIDHLLPDHASYIENLEPDLTSRGIRRISSSLLKVWTSSS